MGKVRTQSAAKRNVLGDKKWEIREEPREWEDFEGLGVGGKGAKDKR